MFPVAVDRSAVLEASAVPNADKTNIHLNYNNFLENTLSGLWQAHIH
jgi:hypothetical protein